MTIPPLRRWTRELGGIPIPPYGDVMLSAVDESILWTTLWSTLRVLFLDYWYVWLILLAMGALGAAMRRR